MKQRRSRLVTDRAGNMTRFEYRTDREHYWKGPRPAGRTGARRSTTKTAASAALSTRAGNPVQVS